MTTLFDILLAPFLFLGDAWALILISGLFGILALIAFKYISYQKGIKSAKDKIKAHLIEIRIYQDDLGIVAKAFWKVMARNLQYLTYNFGPFVPLSIPFAFLLAQLVVRFAFAPVPVEEQMAGFHPGQGTVIKVEMASGNEGRVRELSIEYPAGIRVESPLATSPTQGLAWQEVVATAAGQHEIVLQLPDGTRETKLLVAGDEPTSSMQPERGRGFLAWLLWPAESNLASDSPFSRVSFAYPDRDLGWLPGGVVGVLLVFLIASMAFGLLATKPLKIQI